MILVPDSKLWEDGGLEPHPKSYSGLPFIKRLRHLAASSSTPIRPVTAKFAPLH